jgi:hypothetical protein
VTAYFIFKALPIIIISAHVGYLIYVTLSPDRRKKAIEKVGRKYREGSLLYDLCLKMYSPGALIGWVLILLLFTSSIAFDIYGFVSRG